MPERSSASLRSRPPRAEALGRIRRSLATGLAVGGLLLIVTGVFLWQLLARTVINPIKQLTAIAVRLADGDTQVGLRQCTRRDEIGQLTNAFDRTIAPKTMPPNSRLQ